MFQREHIQNVDNTTKSTFVEVYNGEMNNNDHSSREIISTQWPFYKRICIFEMRN